MKNLNDKTYRHELIERYLDADTCTEEENALIDFYRHSKEGDLTEEDLSIRNLMLGIASYTLTSSGEKETSPKVSNGKQPKSYAIRLSAILLAAAMIAGLIFLVFPVKNMFSNKSNLVSLVPTTQVIRSYHSSTDDSNESLNPAEEMERLDSLFLATTKDIEVSSPKKNILSNNKIATKQAKEKTNRKNRIEREEYENLAENETQENTQENLNNDFNHYYEIASIALPTADQLKIDKQGDNVIITTVDVEGNTQHFTINTINANDGLYQLQPLAQLNE